jgi:hypothetical protein
MMLLPFTIHNSGAYCPLSGKITPKKRFFYSLPVVKVLSSSVSCIFFFFFFFWYRHVSVVVLFNFPVFQQDIFFMVILVVNVVSVDPSRNNQARFDFMWYEWLLWAWLFSSLVEEVHQFSQDPSKNLFYSAFSVFCTNYSLSYLLFLFYLTENHFSQISNRMDLVMYALLSTCIA